MQQLSSTWVQGLPALRQALPGLAALRQGLASVQVHTVALDAGRARPGTVPGCAGCGPAAAQGQAKQQPDLRELLNSLDKAADQAAATVSPSGGQLPASARPCRPL